MLLPANNLYSDTGLMRLVSFMLVPLACWQLWIFPFIPYYHLQHLFAYPVCLYFLWLLWTGHISIANIYKRWRAYIPIAVAFVLLQSVAQWHNALLPETASLAQWMPPVSVGLCKMVLMWPMLIIIGEICLFTVQRTRALQACVRGYVFASLALLLLCLVQGIAVYTVESDNSHLQSLHQYCASSLRTISPYLEARWVDAVYDFYKNGAYSLTTHRLNGFFEEASALAAWIGTFFLPLSFGCIFVRNPRAQYLPLYGWLSAILWIMLLFLLRSTTGQGIAIMGLLLLLVFSLRGKAKFLTSSLAILTVGACLAIALYAPYVGTYLQGRSKYWDISTLPRIIIMRDTVDIILKHPLVGVGRGNFSAHIVQGTRFKAQVNSDVELASWQRAGSVPPLSALLGFTSQYGIPLTLLVLLGMGRLYYILYQQWRKRPHEIIAQFAFAAHGAWCVLAGLASIGSLDFRNPLFMLPLCASIAIAQWQKSLPTEAPHGA